VAETLETPTHGLAERDTGDLADDIEAWADVDASNLRSGSRVTSAEQLMGREPDLRAAAAQLRQLDRIKALVLDDEWALRDLLVVALNDAWGDHVGDTHCYPEVLNVTRGPMVEADFAKGNFTLMAAGWLQRRLRDALEADDGA
jgi:hypothetical protein